MTSQLEQERLDLMREMYHAWANATRTRPKATPMAATIFAALSSA